MVKVEATLHDRVSKDLEKKGYRVEAVEDWDNIMGSVCAILVDPHSGKLLGGADPREVSWAEGK